MNSFGQGMRLGVLIIQSLDTRLYVKMLLVKSQFGGGRKFGNINTLLKLVFICG